MASHEHHSSEIEARCLSSLFHSPSDVYAAVRDGLTTDAFFFPKHRAIFKALCQASAEDRASDIVTVWRKLSGMGGDVAGVLMQELVGIEGLEPTSVRRSRFTADVVGLWNQRKLVQALSSAFTAANTPANSWADCWEAAEPHFRAAQQAAQHSAERTVADMARTAQELILNGDRRAVIGTGIEKWDQQASPLRAGELVVIAARPGAGKTALALNMADFSVRNFAGATAFFSMEMSGEELVVRMATTAAGIAGIHDFKKRAPAAAAIGAMKNFFVYEAASAGSIAQIEARARLLASSPNGLRAIFVDYLQLIAPPADTRRDNRERQVAELSRRFKLLAGELKCPVVLLAQINRESEKEQRRPRLSDLRESGAIEQDADRVWFLYMPNDKNAKHDESASEIKVALYQAKCRNGRPGIETVLKFNRPLFKFTPHEQT